jgi:hypothetical protein
MNNLAASLVELRINIQRAADTDRPVVREIYLRKSTELVDALLKCTATSDRNGRGKPKVSEQQSEQQPPFPALGDAPAYLDAFQKEVWAELSARMLPGVCADSDRTAFELLVLLVCKMRTVAPEDTSFDFWAA